MTYSQAEGPGLIYRCREDMVVTDLQDEVVLLDPRSVEMYSLAAVGRLIWQALPGTPEQVSEQVAAAYDIDPQQALEDVRNLLEELSAAGLVETDAV